MSFDQWKSTDQRDGEPGDRQVRCEECAGTGAVAHATFLGLMYTDCRCCDGAGQIVVTE